MTNDDLYELWDKTCSKLSVPDEGKQSMWSLLVARYAETHRRYHTLEHLGAMCGTLHEFEDRLQSPVAVYTAVFFHDAIYDASSKNNEVDSAVLAKKFLSEHAVENSIIETVEALILATAAHMEKTAVRDAAWFLDADLAILGADRDQYDRYVLAIRHEYANIPDSDFRAGRQRFLETILAAGSLFRTDELKDRFEARARSNLQIELDRLRSDVASDGS